jgi:hypothetical protein
MIAAGLLSACGATAPETTPARTPGHTETAAPTPTPTTVPTSYCDAQDTLIPGAAAALASGAPDTATLTPVQQAWLQVDATMVPACSEITPEPLPVQTKNLTSGLLSDADLATWVELDSTGWALWEWAGQHGQYFFMRFLYPPGNDATGFIAQGGKIVDNSPECEYPIKVYAVSITADQMSHFTGAAVGTAGLAFALAWAGPCTTTWTSASGQTTQYPINAGQEYRELEITETETAPALGQYLVTEASIDPGADTTAALVLQESGV